MDYERNGVVTLHCGETARVTKTGFRICGRMDTMENFYMAELRSLYYRV